MRVFFKGMADCLKLWGIKSELHNNVKDHYLQFRGLIDCSGKKMYLESNMIFNDLGNTRKQNLNFCYHKKEVI